MNINLEEHDIAVYAGYLREESLIKESSSGGIATSLAKKIISQGGYVAGVIYSKDVYKIEYLISNNIEDIQRFKGTKYAEVDLKDVFRNIKELLQKEKKVLFFGVPCIVSALKKYCADQLDNLILCEMICHGPVSKKVHKEYIKYLEEKYKSKVIDFNVRYKVNGQWTPKYLMAKFSNGKIIKLPFEETEYGMAFAIMGMEKCYHCSFKGNLRQGDIMLGDFWGANRRDVFWNDSGVSVIFAETEKGNRLLNSLDDILLFPTTFEKAIKFNPMVIKSKIKNNMYDKFKTIFEEFGLITAIKKCIPLKVRIKIKLKNILIRSR